MGGFTLRRALAGPVGAAALAGLLAVGLAAPVLRAPGERLFGSEIVGRHHDPYTMVELFERPRAPGLYTQPVTDYAGAALAAAAGDGVVAYNLLALASFPLAACFAFLLAQRLTGSRRAAWVAALVYAFAPFHLAHAAYHPHVTQIQWLPLFLLAVWLCLEAPRAGRLALAAAAAALLVLASFYNAPLAAVATPVLIAAGAPAAAPAGRRLRHAGRTLAALGVAAAAGVAWVAAFAPRALAAPQSLAFPRQDLARYGARPWSYLLPPVEHPLLGELSREVWRRQKIGDGLVEQQVTVGLGLALLAAIAGGLWLRSRRAAAPAAPPGAASLAAVPVLALLAVAGFAFSLPPDWRLGGAVVPGPSAALYAVAPMFRAHARFGLLVLLAAAILAGIAVDRLGRAPRARGPVVAWALVAVVAFELTPWPPWRWRPVLPTEAHRWLALEPDGPRALDCVSASDPAQRGADRRLAGRLGRLGPYDDCGAPDAASRAAAAGYELLLVRRPGPLARRLTEAPPPPGLSLLRRFDDSLVLAVEAEPSPLLLRLGPGFHWREYKGSATYRWMAGDGVAWIENRSGTPLAASLALRLHAFPGPRRIELDLDGRPLEPIEVGTEPALHPLGAWALEAGRHTLRLRAATPPAVPDEILGNGDRRPITVALWEWQLVAEGAPTEGD